MRTFLETLSEHVLDEPDVSAAIAKTRRLLDIADSVWDDALAHELSDKVTMMHGSAVIRPSRISELGARITEQYGGADYDRPIADFVQQGGGMYGIALAGYTYIMERAGLRFYSLGGTSAGGINAMLIGALPNSIYGNASQFIPGRQACKSELLAHIIMNTNFDKFMDRGGIAGKIQGIILRNVKSVWIKLLIAFIFILLPVLMYVSIGSIFNSANGITIGWVRVYDFLIGTLAAAAPLILVYILFVRLLGINFGINTGDAFYNWIKTILADPFIGIATTQDLQNRLSSITFNSKNPNDCARMVLITSNLTYNRIVKFPEKAGEYWDKSADVSPAAYVRATMSIPFVFETFIPDIRDVGHFEVPKITKARFVDGGMLSNFPIREFHNNSINKPRFPTFGVLLNPSDIDPENKPSTRDIRDRFAAVSLFGYMGSFLSTFRNFYDNDYLRSSEEIKLRVVAVETKGYNWLDFWMPETKRQELFRKGAQAAVRQLNKFDFETYLEKR